MISIRVSSEMWKVEVRLISFPFGFSDSIDDGISVDSWRHDEDQSFSLLGT